ncbi:hypothetical protein Tco_0426082, partial [Tanacetum coccineum]
IRKKREESSLRGQEEEELNLYRMRRRWCLLSARVQVVWRRRWRWCGKRYGVDGGMEMAVCGVDGGV